MELGGPIFKKIRQRKGFSVAETSKGICSPQFLRKYEAGNSDISFTNMLLLLDRINVTMDEFLFECNTQTFDTFFRSFEIKYEKVIHSKNALKKMELIQELEANYEKSADLKYQLLLIMVQNMYNLQHPAVFTVDWQPIRRYLQQVEQWDRFEFYLCTHSWFPISNEELFQISRKLLRQSKQASGTLNYVDDFLTHLAKYWFEEGELGLCRKLIDDYFARHYEEGFMNYLIMDVFMKFFEGMLEIKTGHRAEGIKKCETIIQLYVGLDIHPSYVASLYELYVELLNEGKE